MNNNGQSRKNGRKTLLFNDGGIGLLQKQFVSMSIWYGNNVKRYLMEIQYRSIAIVLCVAGTLVACTSPAAPTAFDYGTKSDSARYYFFNGWEEIMDNGRWTEAEKSFRKAVAADPGWMLGKSLVGRITGDVEERLKLHRELDMAKDRAGEDERLLLDVNLLSMEAANNRDQGIKNTQEFNNFRRRLAELNFGKFARKYPDDRYFKAEYIEILHANHGAKVALDSLRSLATAEQLDLGFYIGYAAKLELELGHLDKAIALSDLLKDKMTTPSFTSYLVLKAEIYMAQDSLMKARENIDKAVKLDPNNLIASGIQSQINDKLAN